MRVFEGAASLVQNKKPPPPLKKKGEGGDFSIFPILSAHQKKKKKALRPWLFARPQMHIKHTLTTVTLSHLMFFFCKKNFNFYTSAFGGFFFSSIFFFLFFFFFFTFCFPGWGRGGEEKNERKREL